MMKHPKRLPSPLTHNQNIKDGYIKANDSIYLSIEDNETIELDLSEFPQEIEPPKPQDAYYKPIDEYDMDGTYIRSYKSIDEAKKITGNSNVTSIAKGKYLYSSSLNKIFLFRGDDIEKRLAAINEKEMEIVNRKQKKMIYEYSLNGKLIYKWPTITEAAMFHKLSPFKITSVCKGTRNSFIDGKIFLYHDGNIQERLKRVKADLYRLSNKKPKYREVNVYTLDGEYIEGFPSASAAARHYKTSVSCITTCCNGKDSHKGRRFTTHNKIFLWIGDSISERLEEIKNNNKK